PARAHEQRTEAGDHAITETEARRTRPGAIEDQQLVFDQDRFGHHGADATRPCEPRDGRHQMKKKHSQITHVTIVARSRNPQKRAKISDSPCTRAMGGLAPAGARWIHARPRFFLPIPVLRKLFRGTLVAGIRDAFRHGRLHLPGSLTPLNTTGAFSAFLHSLSRQTRVVYAKPPF